MEKLRIYNDAILLCTKIYSLTRKQSSLARDYSLCDQLRRASVSIPTNIAEGYNRSIAHNKNYLQIASGSSNEVVALLQIIEKVYGIKTERLQERFKILGKQINAFSKKLTDNR